MSNSSDNRVKSSDDLPEIFDNRNHGIPEVATPEEPEKTALLIENERNSSNLREIDNFSNGEDDNSRIEISKESRASEINIDERLENAKIDPLDASNFVDKPEEENSRDDCKSRRKLKKKKRVLSAVDAFISIFVIAPLTVGFWRGIWGLMDIHGDMFPGTYTFVFGTLMHTSFAILQNLLHEHVVKASRKNLINKILCKILQIFYTYVFGVSCNAQWRGGWIIFDSYFVGHVWAMAGTLLMILSILASFRAIRNLLAPPTMVGVDILKRAFHFPTRYKLNTRDWSLYLLDCAFSVGVVGTLVVFVWRGVWILFDLYLFPEDREYSSIGSLAIGYVIVTVTFSLQPLMRYVCARLQGLPRLIAADGFLLLSFLGTSNVWRGIWNLLDLWLVPDNLELSCWITHVGCFVFLVLLNCSNSILVRGVYIDAEEDDGKCVAFPCHYLRLFFKVEREKKEARRRNLLVASKDFRPRADGNAKDTENGALLPNSTATTILPTNPESLV